MKLLETQISYLWADSNKPICTELCRTGAIDMDLWRADVLYSKENFSKRTMRGYRLWGLPYVRLMRSYPIFAKIAQILATWFIEDIAYQMHCRPVGNWKGWILRELFFKPLCSTIGFLLKEKASSIIRNDKTTAWQ